MWATLGKLNVVVEKDCAAPRKEFSQVLLRRVLFEVGKDVHKMHDFLTHLLGPLVRLTTALGGQKPRFLKNRSEESTQLSAQVERTRASDSFRPI